MNKNACKHIIMGEFIKNRKTVMGR